MGGKQNKNNESLNTTQNSGIGAVFTLVGSQGRLKAEGNEINCVRAESERGELATGGGVPMGRSPGGESPSLLYLALFESPLQPQRHTHTHTHTRTHTYLPLWSRWAACLWPFGQTGARAD